MCFYVDTTLVIYSSALQSVTEFERLIELLYHYSGDNINNISNRFSMGEMQYVTVIEEVVQN